MTTRYSKYKCAFNCVFSNYSNSTKSKKTTTTTTSALLKSKFRSSLDRLKKFFNLNGWNLVPTSPVDRLDSFNFDSDEEYTECESLMMSHQTLPRSASTVTVNTNQNSFAYKPAQKRDNQVKRIKTELIDDETPLIKF